MLQQLAPADSLQYGIGFLNNDRKLGITNITWYYTEDEARISHHRSEHG